MSLVAPHPIVGARPGIVVPKGEYYKRQQTIDHGLRQRNDPFVPI
jgi:hypothetical protein